MLHSAKSAFMFMTAAQIIYTAMYTEQTFKCACESFNIKQKLGGLFVLEVTHISNLFTVFVKLTQMGGWV